jgi:hypothetical protein
MAKTGQDALARLGMDGKTVAQVVTAQTRIIAACWLMSFLGLSLTRQKFLIMESIPVPVDTEDETDVETKKES